MCTDRRQGVPHDETTAHPVRGTAGGAPSCNAVRLRGNRTYWVPGNDSSCPDELGVGNPPGNWR